MDSYVIVTRRYWVVHRIDIDVQSIESSLYSQNELQNYWPAPGINRIYVNLLLVGENQFDCKFNTLLCANGHRWKVMLLQRWPVANLEHTREPIVRSISDTKAKTTKWIMEMTEFFSFAAVAHWFRLAFDWKLYSMVEFLLFAFGCENTFSNQSQKFNQFGERSQNTEKQKKHEEEIA